MPDDARAQVAPVAARPRATRRLDYIDTLRGFAALWVFLVHIHGYWLGNVRLPWSFEGALVRFFGFGGAGVDLFIVLSGFCLTLPLLSGRPAGLHEIDVRRFYRRRAFRLLPAYYAALALVLVVETLPDAIRLIKVPRDLEWFDVLTHATLTFPLFGETLGSVNGSLWSISLEATLYLAFPILLAVYARWGMPVVLALTLAVALAWQAFAGVWLATDLWPALLPSPDKLLPARWVQFALGMGAAILVVRPRPRQHTIALVVAPVALAVGVFGYAQAIGLANSLGFGVASAGALVLLATVPGRVFRHPALHWLTALGTVSYSFYLLHQPVLLATAPLGQALGLGITATSVVALVVAGSITTGLAIVFYRAVERPFLVRGSMRDAIRRAAEEPAPA